MANTYTKLYIHVVFAVQYRDAVLDKTWRGELYQYIIGLVSNRGHKVYAIGGIEDHIHILLSLSPKQALSDLVMEVKRASTLWVKEKQYVRCRFAWQNGYAAFSYAQSMLPTVIDYIRNQEVHHAHRTFREECEAFFKAYQVEYDSKYMFAPLADREG